MNFQVWTDGTSSVGKSSTAEPLMTTLADQKEQQLSNAMNPTTTVVAWDPYDDSDPLGIHESIFE